MLSIDIHPRGISVISGGMDTSIKVWNLCSNCIVNAIQKSYHHYSNVENHAFKTVIDQVPLFTTNQVHSDYVDCMRYIFIYSIQIRLIVYRQLFQAHGSNIR